MPLAMKVKSTIVICALAAVGILSSSPGVRGAVIVALVVLPYWMLRWVEARLRRQAARSRKRRTD